MKDGAPVLLVHADGESAIEALARAVVAELAGAIAARGRARIALAGGSTPAALYRRVARADLARAVRWDAVEVFFGDERCVPEGDAKSNHTLARETLLDAVGARRVHRMEGELEPALAARRYAERLGGVALDVVLLGIGDDGHTASLFPGGAGLAPDDPPVVPARAPAPPVERLSLSLVEIERARSVHFLVLGRSKAAAVGRVWKEWARDVGPSTLPAARVRPAAGVARLHVDREAFGAT